MSKTKEPIKAKPSEPSPSIDSPRWYGIWLYESWKNEILLDPLNPQSEIASQLLSDIDGAWLRDDQGWLIHYPAEAIARAHADAYNSDTHQRAGKLEAAAKPF